MRLKEWSGLLADSVARPTSGFRVPRVIELDAVVVGLLVVPYVACRVPSHETIRIDVKEWLRNPATSVQNDGGSRRETGLDERPFCDRRVLGGGDARGHPADISNARRFGTRHGCQ